MAPRSAEQFESMREHSRALIVEAALTLFARHGYEGASIRMIARKADVSLGLLYNYFGGKDELLLAIMHRGLADVGESFGAALEAGDGARRGDPIERLFRSAMEILRRNRRFWLLFYSIRTQPAVVEGLAGEIAALQARIDEGLRAILTAAGSAEPAVDARLLFATIDGIGQQLVLDPEAYPVDAVIDRAVALFSATTTGGTR
jgi:AcrR family transcriptional regulator